MVQETVAHIQTASWFAFQVMPFIFSQDIHPNASDLMVIMYATGPFLMRVVQTKR